MKSLSIKGAELAAEKYLPVKESLNVLSPDTNKKFWSVYNKLVNEYAMYDKMYKYEIMEFIMDSMLQGIDEDEIQRTITRLYDETRENLPYTATEQDVKLLFTEKLDEFRRKL